MSWFLIADNVVSVVLVFVFWTLAHQNSGGREPLARTIATGYALAAMIVLGSMLFHNLDALASLIKYADLALKIILAITLGAVANRLGLLYRPD